MNNIIAYIKSILCIGCLLFVTSCGDDGVEVISQDVSWTMDSQYIEEDVREELGIDPFTDLIYFSYYSTPLMLVKANYDLEHVTLVGDNDYSFKVKITKPFKEDLKLKLTTSPDAHFPVAVEEYAKVADDNCILGTAVLKAGELETTIKFSFKDIDKLNELPGSVLALTLAIENQQEHLSVSKSRGAFFMKVDTAIQIENIEASNEPIEGDLFNDNLTFESDRTSGLVSLNDGDRKKNSWWTSGVQSYLTTIFSSSVTLKGIRIDTNPGATSAYALKSVKVMVDNGNGQFLSNGVYDQGHKEGVVYIKFKKPIKCEKIRLEYFVSTTGKFGVDVNEVAFIK